MDEKVIELLKWVVGIFLTILGALGSYIYFLHKERNRADKDNRDERMKSTEKQTDALNKNSDILSGLKMLLENENRNRTR